MIRRVFSQTNIFVAIAVLLVGTLAYMLYAASHSEERACRTGNEIVRSLDAYKSQYGCFPIHLGSALRVDTIGNTLSFGSYRLLYNRHSCSVYDLVLLIEAGHTASYNPVRQEWIFQTND